MEEFEEWWGDLSSDMLSKKRVAILAWNKALQLACEDFSYQEGTDYGVEESLKVKMVG